MPDHDPCPRCGNVTGHYPACPDAVPKVRSARTARPVTFDYSGIPAHVGCSGCRHQAARIRELVAENDELRRRVAALEGQMPVWAGYRRAAGEEGA